MSCADAGAAPPAVPREEQEGTLYFRALNFEMVMDQS
jgi:hypothetical protein